MSRSQIDLLIEKKSLDEAIEEMMLMLKEEPDEYILLKLAEAYGKKGDIKEAKKTLRKLNRLFSSGDYFIEAEQLMNKLTEANDTESDKQSDPPVKTGMMRAEKENMEKTSFPEKDEKQDGLTAAFNAYKKQKHKRQIPQNIQECFEGTVGMESVAEELEKFYNMLRLQNDRKKNDFQPDLLKSTHFMIVGSRGSGKTLVGNIIGKLLYDFGIRSTDETVQIGARDILRAYDSGGDGEVERLFSQIDNKTVIVENLQDILLERESVPERQIALCLEKIMKERKSELSIILTGNKEAKSSFFENSKTLEDVLFGVIEIPQYSPIDLCDIAEKLAKERALRIHESAKKNLLYKIKQECDNSDFMNAISLGRYLHEAAGKMADRYNQNISNTESDMVNLMPQDFDVEIEEEGVDELIAKLDAMTGLASAKAQVKKRINAVEIAEQARKAGADDIEAGQGSLHMLFQGNPGTGKTTVARLLGKIYQQLGVLPHGNLVECNRSDLVGEYQGHTAKRVREKVREAKGGVLFIDEAYSLYQGDRDSFGKEAIDELVAAMENNRNNMMVILAGYTEEMKEFLKTNSGLRSRIRNDIMFEDYNTEEMVEIFKSMIKDRNMCMAQNTEELLHQLVEVKSKVPDFGNARGVRNLVEDVKEAMDARLQSLQGELAAEQYKTICEEDLQKVLNEKSTGSKDVQELIDELNALTGLESAKKKVQEMINNIRVKDYMIKNGWEGNEEHGTLHLVFKGNAGTGKTTVARLLGQIYKKLGVLKKDVFVEVGRGDLVAKHLGETAEKTMKKIKEADGGILFIDEAYNLKNSKDDSFGQEAVTTLLAEMENRRENLMVIIAGYPEEIDKFLDANQGLDSRFSNEIIFDDYTLEELQAIFEYIVKDKNMLLMPELKTDSSELIKMRKAAVKDFGNARGVRNIVEDLEKKKNSRIAKLVREGKNPTHDEVRTLTKDDFMELSKEYANRKK